MDYETTAHTFYISTFAQVLPKLDLSAMFSYTLGKGEIDDLSYDGDTFQVDTYGPNMAALGQPPRLDDYSFTNINGSEDYSDLDYTMWELELSGSYSLTDALGLTVTYWYSDYEDDEEYVYGDLTGDAYSLMGYVTYRF